MPLVVRQASLLLGVSVLLLPVFGLTANGRAAAACGVERWRVKTLTDPDVGSVNFRAKDATVDALRALPAPGVGTHAPRLPGAEMKVYRVKATLLRAKVEDDGDIHLVIADPRAKSHTMIVELPDHGCTAGAPSTRRGQMTKARNDFAKACGDVSGSFVKLTGTATIRGVGFFDILHGQSGVAPNGIELHPVLGFKSGDCAKLGGTPPPPPPTPPSPATPPPVASPPAPAQNCDPSYPTICLQDGIGDWDCAGGSGDGPNYVTDKGFQVLPPDPFGLDRDGDGVGCEG